MRDTPVQSRISRKVVGSYLILASLAGLIAAFGYWEMAKMDQSARVIEQEFRDLSSLLELQGNFDEWVHLLKDIGQGLEGIEHDEMNGLFARCENSLRHFKNLWKDDERPIASFEKEIEQKEQDILGSLTGRILELKGVAEKMFEPPGTQRADLLKSVVAIAKEAKRELEDFKRHDREESRLAVLAADRVRKRSFLSFPLLVGTAYWTTYLRGDRKPWSSGLPLLNSCVPRR